MKLAKYFYAAGECFVHQETAELDTIIKADAWPVQITLLGKKSHHEPQIMVIPPKE